MKRIPVVLLIVGLLMLGVQRYFEFRPDTLPLPADGLAVRMSMNVKSSGAYHLLVSMPKADQALALGLDSISCAFTVSLASPDREMMDAAVASLRRYGEIGFANVQLYQGQPWQLDTGAYDVSIHADSPCEAARSRGGAVSFEREVTQPTERYLGYMIVFYLGALLAGLGLLGIVAREFRKSRG